MTGRRPADKDRRYLYSSSVALITSPKRLVKVTLTAALVPLFSHTYEYILWKYKQPLDMITNTKWFICVWRFSKMRLMINTQVPLFSIQSHEQVRSWWRPRSGNWRGAPRGSPPGRTSPVWRRRCRPARMEVSIPDYKQSSKEWGWVVIDLNITLQSTCSYDNHTFVYCHPNKGWACVLISNSNHKDPYKLQHLQACLQCCHWPTMYTTDSWKDSLVKVYRNTTPAGSAENEDISANKSQN